MPKRAPRLQFSEDELADPVIRKAAEKAEKAADRLEKAEKKIPKKTVKKRVVDSDGKVTTRLSLKRKSRRPSCPTSPRMRPWIPSD